jgi:hypothetical protein
MNACPILFLQARSQSFIPAVKFGLNSACAGVNLTFIQHNKTVNFVFLDHSPTLFQINNFFLYFNNTKNFSLSKSLYFVAGIGGRAVGRGTELQTGTLRVQPPMASFQSHYGAGFDSVSNRNE